MNNIFDGIVIDPGHGGIDSGAVGKDILEKDFTLLISKYMYDRFKELGIPVYLTRDSDITLPPKDRVNKILSFFGNNPNIVVISNHLNAGGGEGAEVIYALRNKDVLANSILKNIGTTGQETRKVYQRRLPMDPTKDYYFIHRETGNTEPLIIEYGFIDNNKDVNFLKDNYQELAEEVIKSVLEYKNIPYIPPEKGITDTYIVEKGDTLYSISKKFDTTISELKELNNLSTNMLNVGQILKLPTEFVDIENDEIYEVKAGDTLYSISKKFNIPIEQLKELNALTTNMLNIGQKLIIKNI